MDDEKKPPTAAEIAHKRITDALNKIYYIIDEYRKTKSQPELEKITDEARGRVNSIKNFGKLQIPQISVFFEEAEELKEKWKNL